MKDKLNIISDCLRNKSEVEGLNNIEFHKDKIIACDSLGSIVVIKCNNEIIIDEPIAVDKSLIKILNNFDNPSINVNKKSLDVKKGKKKSSVPYSKDIIFNLPEKKEECVSIKVNEDFVNMCKKCLYAAKGNSINTQGDGIVLDFTGKLIKRAYASNGQVLITATINTYKEKFKTFLPIHICNSITKYYTDDSILSVCNTYIKYESGNNIFISLLHDSDDSEIDGLLTGIKTVSDSFLVDTIKSLILDCAILTDNRVEIKFTNNLIEIIGYHGNSVIVNKVETDNKLTGIKISVDKNNIKYAVNNFEEFSVCEKMGFNFLKFKSNKVFCYISPID